MLHRIVALPDTRDERGNFLWEFNHPANVAPLDDRAVAIRANLDSQALLEIRRLLES